MLPVFNLSTFDLPVAEPADSVNGERARYAEWGFRSAENLVGRWFVGSFGGKFIDSHGAQRARV